MGALRSYSVWSETLATLRCPGTLIVTQPCGLFASLFPGTSSSSLFCSWTSRTAQSLYGPAFGGAKTGRESDGKTEAGYIVVPVWKVQVTVIPASTQFQPPGPDVGRVPTVKPLGNTSVRTSCSLGPIELK